MEKENAKAKSKYITKDFLGVVHLKDWLSHVNGHSYITVLGKCSVIEGKDMIGFEVQKTESNWLIRIEGNGDAINVLGCQIRAVTALTKVPTTVGTNCLNMTEKV
jgi:hypothetical protein